MTLTSLAHMLRTPTPHSNTPSHASSYASFNARSNPPTCNNHHPTHPPSSPDALSFTQHPLSHLPLTPILSTPPTNPLLHPSTLTHPPSPITLSTHPPSPTLPSIHPLTLPHPPTLPSIHPPSHPPSPTHPSFLRVARSRYHHHHLQRVDSPGLLQEL